MSRRITFTKEDAELIIAALENLHKSSIINEAVYKHYGIASRQRIEQIKAKLVAPSQESKEDSHE